MPTRPSPPSISSSEHLAGDPATTAVQEDDRYRFPGEAFAWQGAALVWRGCAPHLAYVGLCPTPRLVASRGPMPCAASSRARMRALLNANGTRGPRGPHSASAGRARARPGCDRGSNVVQADDRYRFPGEAFAWQGAALVWRGCAPHLAYVGLCPTPRLVASRGPMPCAASSRARMRALLNANGTRRPRGPHSASAGRARARPGCDRGSNVVQADDWYRFPGEAFAWQGATREQPGGL